MRFIAIMRSWIANSENKDEFEGMASRICAEPKIDRVSLCFTVLSFFAMYYGDDTA